MHGAISHHEPLSDRGVFKASGHQGQDVGLAWAEAVQACVSPGTGEQLCHDFAVDGGAAVRDAV